MAQQMEELRIPFARTPFVHPAPPYVLDEAPSSNNLINAKAAGFDETVQPGRERADDKQLRWPKLIFAHGFNVSLSGKNIVVGVDLNQIPNDKAYLIAFA